MSEEEELWIQSLVHSLLSCHFFHALVGKHKAAGAENALSANKNIKARFLLIPKGAMAAPDRNRMFPSGAVAIFQASHFGSPTFLLFLNYCETLLDAIEQLLRSNPDVRKLYLEFILKALE